MSSPRRFLLPFSWIYGAGVYLRNKLFEWDIKKSVSFEIPVISVGNLSAGGTGKTPHVAYLIRLFQPYMQVGVISRGYGRRSKGYLLVEENSPVDDTGDEPLELKLKFPESTVAVCEERAIGIPIMLLDNPSLEIILLDDGFQHRRVTPGLSILLTTYSHPYTADQLLPAGNLREPVTEAARADVIIVTKCPGVITNENRVKWKHELNILEHQRLFFSYTRYGIPCGIFDRNDKILLRKTDTLLLFCGIADPTHLVNELKQQVSEVKAIIFGDHHHYSLHDMKMIHAAFQKLEDKTSFIITTEKDAVKLNPFKDFFSENGLKIYCMPVETEFFPEDKERFDKLMIEFIKRTNREFSV
jgi:tetraacyldisaccharide 4'-kinase